MKSDHRHHSKSVSIMSFDNEIALLLASFLRHISENATSYWFLVLENDKPSNTTNEVRQLWTEAEIEKHKNIEIMNDSSLQRYSELERDQYISMLLKCKLVRTKGKYIIVDADNWKKFFIYHQIDAEIDPSKPLTTPKANYIRIGKKEDQYHTNVVTQAKHCVFAPPRCRGIGIVRRGLREGLRRLMPTQDDLDNRKAASTAAADNDSLKNNQSNSKEATNASGNENIDKDNGDDAIAEKPSRFHMLRHFKIDPESFSSNKGAKVLKQLLGELITVQQMQSGNKSIVDFTKMQQSKSSTAVIIQSHKNKEAFERYHRRGPYIDEVIRCMDSDEDVAVQRLSSYLAKKHKSNFIQAAEEAGLPVVGIMNEIECGAMISEAGLLDTQYKIVMKHFKHKYNGANIAVPFRRVKDHCCQGFTVPKVKVYEHRRDGKEAEIIVAEYQSVAEEFKLAVVNLMTEHNVKSRTDIEGIKLVIGGDHGQGAFRLCILIIMELKNREPVDVAVSIGKVFCTKEEGLLLDETIMDWISTDLQLLHDCQVVMGVEDRKCVVKYLHYNAPELDTLEEDDLLPIEVEQFSAGDCAWQSYLNGKLNMSPHWCLYCPLHRSKFSEEPDPDDPVVDWTIQTLTEMADDTTKKGVARLGVTGRPYFPWIPMINRILPILHLLLGIGNDIITYFGHVVEWNLIHLPEEEKGWQKEAIQLKESIPSLQAECENWDNAAYGNTTKSKRRTKLMADRRKAAGLNPEQKAEFDRLESEFKAVRKVKADAVARRKKLLTLINAAAKSRRTPPADVQETWYLAMEKIYRSNGVVREDYYKKMFSGRPMRDIMKNAEAIFNEAKTMLRRYKDDTVPDIDAKIDEHCSKVVDLLQTWNEFFHILHKKSPVQQDFDDLDRVAAEAERKHRIVRTVVDNSDDVPKPHMAGRHASKQFRTHKGLLRKMYEQFVEHNHQIEVRNEAKSKRIPNHEDRAETSAKRRRMDTHTDIVRQNRKVSETSARGKYKKDV